ncbi:hypothetical protein FOZ63_000596 [Perkinsus olseni]|uniref:Uncharacterized protein n=1 Tax=Perkinsus olseni TaxID=32597 RepID=A0A7J6RST4_PEROL|nr:hypothetical protein FOZ63_000596 [Perkinsus olseni]KAF4723717.1 hypothetical protein FOZ62_000497 [Perkinsus olseni]
MTFFVVRILLIIGLVVATPDGYSEPKVVEEFRPPIMQEGAAMSPYQFNDNFIVTALRGSESRLLPGLVKKVSSDSLKLQDSLCDFCQFCFGSLFGSFWAYCWPAMAECGGVCDCCN